MSEAEIEDAMVALLAADQVVAEASARGRGRRRARGRVAADGPLVAIVTGGNVDARVLARLLAARYLDAGARP